MDIGSHQLVQRPIDELVTLQRAQPGEGARNDVQPEVAAAIACARMACMAMAVVDQCHRCVRPGPFELCADSLDAAHLVSVCILEASQKPWPSANSNVSPIVPYILKLTQTFSGKLYATYRLSAPIARK